LNPIRADIQALRGWAVALVVLYHAGLPGLPGGYLGVDLFFVLSGALITGLIRDAVDAGQFRCRDFYLRRARRLLPAALVTLTATTLAAAWVLDAPEWVDFRDQLAGTLAFSANWVLWSQTGYFEGAAELKPLLHMWSLALEEQYYLLLPPLLLALPRGHWRGAMLALTAVSALLCGAASRFDPSAAFYTLPCRAWELGLGSCVALAPGGGAGANPTLVQRHLLRVTACAVLAGVPLLTLPGPHPGWGAVWVAGATAVLLRWPPLQAGLPAGGLPSGPAGRAVAALRRTAASLLVGLGNRSYSLYLVHWPLFALLHNASLGAELPALWRARRCWRRCC
jgi:peptidoglycan/LPS O-acetylase OafA/YrhL